MKSVERCIDTNIQNGYSIFRDRETSRNVSFHAGVLRAFCWAASFGCFDSPQFDGAKEKNAENLCRVFGKAFLKMPSSRSNKQFGKGKNDQKKSAPAESAECAFGCWNRPVELPVRLVAVAGRYQQGRTQRSARGGDPKPCTDRGFDIRLLDGVFAVGFPSVSHQTDAGCGELFRTGSGRKWNRPADSHVRVVRFSLGGFFPRGFGHLLSVQQHGASGQKSRRAVSAAICPLPWLQFETYAGDRRGNAGTAIYSERRKAAVAWYPCGRLHSA